MTRRATAEFKIRSARDALDVARERLDDGPDLDIDDLYETFRGLTGLVQSLQRLGQATANRTELFAEQHGLYDVESDAPTARINTVLQGVYRMNSHLGSAVQDINRVFAAIDGLLLILPGCLPSPEQSEE